MALSLPVFAETLDAYGISLKLLFRALDEYYDLSTEVLLDLEPQLEPFHFLAQSDQRDRIVAFRGLLVAQSPGTYYLPDEDEDEEGEGE